MPDFDRKESPAPEPLLRKRRFDPRGVMQKHAKAGLFLGVAALLMVALLFSAKSPNSSHQKGTAAASPQPLVQDNTDNNVAEMKSQIADQQRALEKEKATDQALAAATASQRIPAQAAAVAGSFPCISGQPCPQASGYPSSAQGGAASQPSPAEQAAEQLAAKERERQYDSRFASNLVYSRGSIDTPTQREPSALTNRSGEAPQPELQPSSLPPTRELVDSGLAHTASKRHPEVNIDAATGPPYVVFEGTTIDAVLMNRLDGDAVGPVKVLVSNPVYSHDRQHVLIPEGTIVLGEAKKIGGAGFGQQRRLSVAFHRLLMPDGYSVDLDQFHGLDQIGEEGLRDQVNNHYLQIFGTSIALGVIAGAAQASQGGGVYAGSGTQVLTNGAAASVSQSATTVLDRFMQIPPTITIREGHRVKVYITQDMLLPAYENHTIPGSF